MKTPICEVCLNSDLLCSACKEKLDSGRLSDNEINILKFLFKLSSKIRTLSDAKIIKVINSDVVLIIAGRGDAARIVGKAGSVVKALAKEFNKPIRVVEEADNFKEFLKNLFSPVPVVGINTVYTPEGEVHKVRISQADRNRVHVSKDIFSEIITNMYDNKVELAFE